MEIPQIYGNIFQTTLRSIPPVSIYVKAIE